MMEMFLVEIVCVGVRKNDLFIYNQCSESKGHMFFFKSS